MNSTLPLRPIAFGTALLFAGSLTALAQGTTRSDDRAYDRDDTRQQQPRSAEEAARQAGGQAASKIIGSDIKDSRGESVGEVEDLVIDLQSGRVTGVIVSSGGMLGMGKSRSVVSPQELRPGEEGEFHSSLTRERLGAGQDRRDDDRVTAGNERERERWDRDRADRERRDRELAERAGPVRGADEPMVGNPRRDNRDNSINASERNVSERDADNTARNRRDRDHRSVDPLDQSNSRADVETTARIRSSLVANDRLSTNAKNVKIITREGQVTLRGPVNSEEEKRIIADLAAEAAPGRVTNNLEVTNR